MKTQTYIENRDALSLLTKALKYANQNQSAIKASLCEQISRCRSYLTAKRAGEYDYVADMYCGQQDSFYDGVDAMFNELEALKVAYDVSKGNAGRMTKLFNRATGVM